MQIHYSAFVIATIVDVLLAILTTIYYNVYEKPEDSFQDNKGLRIKISVAFLSIIHTIAWDFVQVVMLVVFVKYGRPIERNAQIVVENRLQAA